MRKVLIIGIGAGNPDYMTVQAIEALNRAAVFFIPDKGTEKAELRRLREEICKRFIKAPSYRMVGFPVPQRGEAEGDYRGSVEHWRAKVESAYEKLLMEQLSDGECGAFLVWGDPSLYDGTLRTIETLKAKGLELDYEVIPGITAVQALAARHRVTLNRIGEPVLITTGRRLGETWPDAADNVVVMLDGDMAFRRMNSADVEIYWGAYLGTEDEILISGRLSEVMGEIERTRTDARTQKGWIMDTYLLRRAERS